MSNATTTNANPEFIAVLNAVDTDILGRKWTFTANFARRFVVDHVHWSGKLRSLLTSDHLTTLERIFDGMGPGWLESEFYYYDWSHTRDSSPEAMVNAANYIISAIYADKIDVETKALQFAQSLMDHGINPAELLK